MTDKTSPAKKTAPADDRNLVTSEESQTGPTIEERMLSSWEKNRGLILGVIFAALLVIVGREVWQYMQSTKEAATRADYGQATTKEERLLFAREHPGHPLAGAALLAAADESYTERLYPVAAQQYAEAVKALDEPALAARARLGNGIALLQSDDAVGGVTALEGLANDAGAPESLRFEALYHLAAHAHAAGDETKARGVLDQLDGLNPTGIWASRATSLRAKLAVRE